MRQNYNRVAAICATVLIFWLLFYTTEPRRRSYSCKTFKSCLLDRPHRYEHPLPVEPSVIEQGKILSDGTAYFERETLGSNPDILILVMNKDSASWSNDFRSTRRSIYDFLDLLVSTGLDLRGVSLGLLTSSADEFDEMREATATLPLARTAIFHHAAAAGDDAGFAYGERHSPAVQRARRAAIAALRNYLMLRSLRDEQHIFWIDADVVELSPGILQTMLAHASAAAPTSPGTGSGVREQNQTNDDQGAQEEGLKDKDGDENQGEGVGEIGLLTARCQQHLMANYDKNAWAVDRSAAELWGPVEDADRARAAEALVATRRYVDGLLAGTGDGDLVALDSVGGTLLYVRARLVRAGLAFPSHNVVGATWAREGWTGIETEGICYLAAHMRGGGGCYVLGGSHHVRHADWG